MRQPKSYAAALVSIMLKMLSCYFKKLLQTVLALLQLIIHKISPRPTMKLRTFLVWLEKDCQILKEKSFKCIAYRPLSITCGETKKHLKLSLREIFLYRKKMERNLENKTVLWLGQAWDGSRQIICIKMKITTGNQREPKLLSDRMYLLCIMTNFK